MTTLTIASGTHISGSVRLGRRSPKRILVPAGTEGTHLGFDFSLDGETWYPRHDDEGTLIAVPFTAATCVELSAALLDRTEWLRIKTFGSASGDASSQSGDATLTVEVV